MVISMASDFTDYAKHTNAKNESTPDEAYMDRNLVVQMLARLSHEIGYKVGIKPDPEWPILYVDLPMGQESWHAMWIVPLYTTQRSMVLNE